jgi:hypothetical protein
MKHTKHYSKKQRHKLKEKKNSRKINTIQKKFNNPNPIMKKYDPVFTIIEPLEISKRVLDFTLLRKILQNYGLTECNQFECMRKKPMFVWLNYDENSMHWLKRKYYYTNVFLQNSLTNTESVGSKEKLHLGMKEHFPEIYKKHLAQSFLLTKSWKPGNEVFIARPINVLENQKEKGTVGIGYGGKDIVIIHNEKSLNDAKNLLNKYDNVLISEYIMSPMLFKSHKCHIRTFFLASIINDEFNAYMLDFGRIFISKLPYELNDWNNPDIHDTHMKTTPTDYFFPLDFTNSNMGRNDIDFETVYNIFKQIRTIFKSIAQLLSKTVNLYDNIKNGFNIFGVDLMIRDDMSVVLIECNDEGTYKSKAPDTHKKLENIIFNWVNDVILESLFGNNNIDNKLFQASIKSKSLLKVKIKRD